MMAPPELPDPSENDLRPIEVAHVPFSDESDNELMDHDGYEPLALDDFSDNQDDEERINEQNSQVLQEQATIDILPPDPNVPSIERAELEIERHVWNAPRQEINITLDEERTAQILNAMSNFTLPNITLPEWADPDDRWKEELLQRIRQRKEAQENSKDDQKT